MSIVDLDEVKEYLDLKLTSDDVLLRDIIDGVESRVTGYTGRAFIPDPPLDGESGLDTAPPVTKTVLIRASGGTRVPPPAFSNPVMARYTIDIPDVREIANVTPLGCSITGYQTLGDAPWRRLVLFGLSIADPPPLPELQITGRFGLYPPPGDLKDAVKIMAARRYRERDAGYADAAVFPDGGVVNFFKQFSPTVQTTLDRYRRPTRLS